MSKPEWWPENPYSIDALHNEKLRHDAWDECSNACLDSYWRASVSQIDLTDEEIEGLLRLIGKCRPEDDDYRIGVNVYTKLQAAKRTPAQIVVEEMHELGHRMVGPKDIDSVLSRIKRWAKILQNEEMP